MSYVYVELMTHIDTTYKHKYEELPDFYYRNFIRMGLFCFNTYHYSLIYAISVQYFK